MDVQQVLFTSNSLLDFWQQHGWSFHAADYLKAHPQAGTRQELPGFRANRSGEPLCVYWLKDILLAGQPELLVASTGELLGETALYPSVQPKLPGPSPVRVCMARSERRPGWYVPLAGLWCDEFFHWVLEYLPRAVLAKESGFAGKYVVPSHAPAFCRKSLELIGIEDQQIAGKGGETWWVEGLLIPEIVNFTVGHHSRTIHDYPELLRRLRREILGRIAQPRCDQPALRLFISRSRADCRRLSNEAELSGLLARFGFRRICMEDYAFDQQVLLASRAQALIGPHGAGLLHALFMPERSLLVEINPVRSAGSTLRAIYELLEHRYYSVCQESPAPEPEPSSFPAPAAEIQAILEQHCSRP